MPKLIIINGPIASGKTTICNRLLKKLTNFAFVDRAYLKDMLKNSGREDAKIIADKTAAFIITELIKFKKDILVQEYDLSILQKIIKKYGRNYEMHSFFLHCNLDSAIARDKKRIKQSGDIEQIIYSHKKVKPETKDIIIDTDKISVQKTLNKILSIISNT